MQHTKYLEKKYQPVTLENVWQLKSSFVQINHITKCSHRNQQAAEEMGIDLTKIALAPPRSHQPESAVRCVLKVTHWANPLPSIQKQLYLWFAHRLRIVRKTSSLSKIKNLCMESRKWDKTTRRSKSLFESPVPPHDVDSSHPRVMARALQIAQHFLLEKQ